MLYVYCYTTTKPLSRNSAVFVFPCSVLFMCAVLRLKLSNFALVLLHFVGKHLTNGILVSCVTLVVNTNGRKAIVSLLLSQKYNNKFAIDGVLLVLDTKLHIRFNINSLNNNISFNFYFARHLQLFNN